jgi:hypothetical protein
MLTTSGDRVRTRCIIRNGQCRLIHAELCPQAEKTRQVLAALDSLPPGEAGPGPGIAGAGAASTTLTRRTTCCSHTQPTNRRAPRLFFLTLLERQPKDLLCTARLGRPYLQAV